MTMTVEQPAANAALNNSNHAEDLSDLLPLEEWRVSRQAIHLARDAGLPFAVGGGIAFSAYSRRMRNTKDLDVFVLPRDRDAWVKALTDAGFQDYYPQLAYDRSWIYRGYREGVILDVIWTMPNHRMVVDEQWLTRGREVVVHGERLRTLPLEALLWSKLYVLQRDRTDWPDILNMLDEQVERVDWDRLLARVDGDAALLGGVLSVFRWLCPERAAAIPGRVWEPCGLLARTNPMPEPVCENGRQRAFLLDTRDWFGPKALEEG